MTEYVEIEPDYWEKALGNDRVAFIDNRYGGCASGTINNLVRAKWIEGVVDDMREKSLFAALLREVYT